MKIKHILLIITILLILILGIFAYRNIKTTGEVVLTPFNYDKGFDNTSYCEINDTGACGPEGVCEFQTDIDGLKVCMGIK